MIPISFVLIGSALVAVVGLGALGFLRASRTPADRKEAAERGLSTLEWILLVAAVGGIATLGVLIARRAFEEAGEETEGQERQMLELATAEAEILMKGMKSYSLARQQGACTTKEGSKLELWSGMFIFIFTPGAASDDISTPDIDEKVPLCVPRVPNRALSS